MLLHGMVYLRSGRWGRISRQATSEEDEEEEEEEEEIKIIRLNQKRPFQLHFKSCYH